MFYEAIYEGQSIWDKCKKKFPNAIITDASDCIHPDRFEIKIEGEEDQIEEQFYIFALKEGFSQGCFIFQLNMRKPPKGWVEKLNEWIKVLN